MKNKLKAFFSALAAKLKAGLETVKAKAGSDIGDLWEKDKGFLLLFGAIVLGVKFRQLLISLIVSSSKSLFNKTEQESDALQKAENTANDQANKLVSDAKKVATEQDNAPSVDDDWNTNQ